MGKKIIQSIQDKIKSLKLEISAIKYTINTDGICTENDVYKINECSIKIQVLNEILISCGYSEEDEAEGNELKSGD
jgi:pentose-5-phosphate-3-epimerase